MGVHTVDKEYQWKEKFRDEHTKLKCLELVMVHGNHNDRDMPYNKAQKLFCWVKWGNPDIEIK